MGPVDGFHTTLERQGSGACRTLIWAAIRILSERSTGKASADSERPHLLLMDEPELCLHPDAIREACRVLYDLPKTKNWQVMISTHSPVFIDLSRNNTSIVRVERNQTGVVQGTTIFRPTRAKLDANDIDELKLLNMCDPHVTEFFFGGRTILVEGDTEYTAFRYVVASNPAKYKGVHVVRGRGKACIKALCKILNQFKKDYAVLHDSDREKIKYKKKPGEMTNPMWTENQSILDATADGRANGKVLLVASVPNFEEAFFGKEADEEKPYTALTRLRTDATALERISALLDSLLDPQKALPNGAIAWSQLVDLAAAVVKFDSSRTAVTATV
jgi:putative ATP-dependent endonuclease of OLD family